MNSSTLAPKLARSWPWLWYCSSPASRNLRARVPSCVRGSCLARALWRDGARESKYSPLEKLVRSVLKHGHPRVDVEEIGEEVRAAEARPAPKSWLALTFNAVVVSVAAQLVSLGLMGGPVYDVQAFCILYGRYQFHC